MRITEKMSTIEKLNILSDAAKYDVACTSSGTDRQNDGTGIGNCVKSGICHSFSADGRCISLLKVLFTRAICGAAGENRANRTMDKLGGRNEKSIYM